ncbi:PH domain-containing protein [Corynebacterium sp. TA-R-1]|uniref:PH domain-containing protein n=1 Tax=Corynebacterium stercoris TaxID=2943490 RepID=A0ABT1G1B1_9CORY|nr:PH domain-containing protein [Corynebacterium stercoris]MCP1387780.1 PH domain-containing protein [Corynebacterium stercoris]
MLADASSQPTPLPTSVEEMHRVSPKLMVPRFTGALIWTAILLGGIGYAYYRWEWTWLLWALAGAAALLLWNLILVPFRVRNLGYLETEDELLLSKGKMWHTITAIPYGRIQFVDVESGPIARALGLKKLEIHTASTTSNSSLPGLPAAEADALRDRLAAKARERMSGL